mmetsp:Transcript_15685/g.42760  ORF Transcript_15685/g.42760 Transcript_15685/m.42760 type:complete len:100 (+) Transcript_15685:599-898(+)
MECVSEEVVGWCNRKTQKRQRGLRQSGQKVSAGVAQFAHLVGGVPLRSLCRRLLQRAIGERTKLLTDCAPGIQHTCHKELKKLMGGEERARGHHRFETP